MDLLWTVERRVCGRQETHLSFFNIFNIPSGYTSGSPGGAGGRLDIVAVGFNEWEDRDMLVILCVSFCLCLR